MQDTFARGVQLALALAETLDDCCDSSICYQNVAVYSELLMYMLDVYSREPAEQNGADWGRLK